MKFPIDSDKGEGLASTGSGQYERQHCKRNCATAANVEELDTTNANVRERKGEVGPRFTEDPSEGMKWLR